MHLFFFFKLTHLVCAWALIHRLCLKQYVYVDDLSVYNAPCSTEGRKKMLFFKQFNTILVVAN